MSKGMLNGKPEVWMSLLPADGLLVEDADWDYVKKHVRGLKIWTWHVIQQEGYIKTDQGGDKHWPFRDNKTARQALRDLIAVLNENDIALVLEKNNLPSPESSALIESLGGKTGQYDDTFQRRALDSTLAHLATLESLGGKVRFVDLDVQSGTGVLPTEKYPEEICKLMLGVQKAHPEIEFFELTNFPNWSYKENSVAYWGGDKTWGDYAAAFESLVREAKRTGAPLRGLTIDNPYDFAIGNADTGNPAFDPKTVDWIDRMLDLERSARENGLEVNLIVNCDTAGKRSMEDLARDTLSFVDLYRERGGHPDRYVVQSWYDHPTFDEIVPESRPYTFTWLVKEVIDRVR